MLVLLDRAFDANAFLADLAGTGAALLARSKSTRNPPVLTHLPDGSYLSCLDGLPVRIIEADLAMTGADGSRVHDRYRLITTLTDHRRYPAAALIRGGVNQEGDLAGERGVMRGTTSRPAASESSAQAAGVLLRRRASPCCSVRMCPSRRQ